MSRTIIIVIAALVVGLVVLAWTTDRYRSNAITYKGQRDKVTERLSLANATITDMQTRQRDVAALDARYTQELADEKAKNDALRDDVAAGRRRLRVNAICTSSVHQGTAAAGVDNAARPRLADTAQRDYFTLRERVTTMQKQLEGAQQYIREQCQ
ncbi:lysis protein [Edwardsiella tarda]|uniref:lysis protein n=1 Tax=Edwardsiella tarda TaxID=636 RepID=UPI000D518010|nr:lysis protein [Edwardsiella tarda]